MGDLCFAESFNALTSGSYHPWMTLILNAAKNGSYVRMERAYPLVAWFSNLYKRLKHPAADLSSARKTHMRYAVDKTEARMRMETDRLDIMTPILKKNSEKGMSRPEIQQTLILLLTGGTEPTASGMSGVAYNVLSHPRVLTKLKEEVVAAYGDGDEILNTKTSSMPYLNAVINESLRMYPPVPARFPRRTGPKGNIIDGHNVPSDRNFHRCEEFIPERWLEDAPAEFKNDALDAVQPFSIGPRNCIGKPMGLLQIRQMLCKLLINFDMQLEPECVDWNNQKARLLWDMPPLWVKLRHRGA
ncbi:hypothetical protein MMC10_003277 [Thelotrema lepadinum]|nr:hypothetical protein [Thelotrema lepadinum]